MTNQIMGRCESCGTPGAVTTPLSICAMCKAGKIVVTPTHHVDGEPYGESQVALMVEATCGNSNQPHAEPIEKHFPIDTSEYTMGHHQCADCDCGPCTVELIDDYFPKACVQNPNYQEVDWQRFIVKKSRDEEILDYLVEVTEEKKENLGLKFDALYEEIQELKKKKPEATDYTSTETVKALGPDLTRHPNYGNCDQCSKHMDDCRCWHSGRIETGVHYYDNWRPKTERGELGPEETKRLEKFLNNLPSGEMDMEHEPPELTYEEIEELRADLDALVNLQALHDSFRKALEKIADTCELSGAPSLAHDVPRSVERLKEDLFRIRAERDGLRSEIEKRDKKRKNRRELFKCSEHTTVDSASMWGCPDCLRELIDEKAKLLKEVRERPIKDARQQLTAVSEMSNTMSSIAEWVNIDLSECDHGSLVDEVARAVSGRDFYENSLDVETHRMGSEIAKQRILIEQLQGGAADFAPKPDEMKLFLSIRRNTAEQLEDLYYAFDDKVAPDVRDALREAYLAIQSDSNSIVLARKAIEELKLSNVRIRKDETVITKSDLESMMNEREVMSQAIIKTNEIINGGFSSPSAMVNKAIELTKQFDKARKLAHDRGVYIEAAMKLLGFEAPDNEDQLIDIVKSVKDQRDRHDNLLHEVETVLGFDLVGHGNIVEHVKSKQEEWEKADMEISGLRAQLSEYKTPQVDRYRELLSGLADTTESGDFGKIIDKVTKWKEALSEIAEELCISDSREFARYVKEYRGILSSLCDLVDVDDYRDIVEKVEQREEVFAEVSRVNTKLTEFIENVRYTTSCMSIEDIPGRIKYWKMTLESIVKKIGVENISFVLPKVDQILADKNKWAELCVSTSNALGAPVDEIEKLDEFAAKMFENANLSAPMEPWVERVTEFMGRKQGSDIKLHIPSDVEALAEEWNRMREIVIGRLREQRQDTDTEF